MNIPALEQQIADARKRGDGREVANLRAQLPFEERQRIFGAWSTAVDRGWTLPRPSVSHSKAVSASTVSRFVRGDGPMPVVAISQAVLSKIKEMRTDAEDGFWLVGPPSPDWRVIQCKRAIWRPAEDDREETSLLVHFDDLDQIDEGLGSARGAKECVVGHLHSQPSTSDPSSPDIKMWADGLHFSGRQAFAGLVMRARTGGAIDLQAFVFSKENGETVHRKSSIYVRS